MKSLIVNDNKCAQIFRFSGHCLRNSGHLRNWRDTDETGKGKIASHQKRPPLSEEKPKGRFGKTEEK